MFSFEPFDPTNEKELFGLYEEGDYNFRVMSAAPHTSQKSGNQSIKASIMVFGNDGSSKMIDVYLTPAYKKLFAHFFRSIGMEDECKTGRISPNTLQDKTGRCTVAIELPKLGEKSDPRNIITDFLKPSEIKKEDDFINDAVPF